MLGLFGYMNFLIFYKWCTDWSFSSSNPNPGIPPNLIDTLISIVLKPGNVRAPACANVYGVEGGAGGGAHRAPLAQPGLA